MSQQRSRFKYQPRSPETVKTRASQKGGMFDSYIKSDIKMLKVGEGDHEYRVLPPTWPDAKHYGYEIYMHFGIGPDNQAYLCLEQQKKGTCPICKERRRCDADEAKKLAPTKRVLMWVIDRDAEQEGPQLWACPWTLDRDISMVSIIKKTGEVLVIDHPDEGYDLAFTRQGTTERTKYQSPQIARHSTPLSDRDDDADAWLDYIEQHLIPDCLVFYEPDQIEQVFNGAQREDDDPSTERVRHTSPSEEEAPPSRRREREVVQPEEDAPPPRRARDEAEASRERVVPTRRERVAPQPSAEERPRRAQPDPPEDGEPPVTRTTKSRSEQEAPAEAPARSGRSRELFATLDDDDTGEGPEADPEPPRRAKR